MTAEELEALWRPHPAFVGPVAPPMWLWIRNRQAQASWRIAVNLPREHAEPNPEDADVPDR
jgi:hypothetical protein